jgi:hypothetical protein
LDDQDGNSESGNKAVALKEAKFFDVLTWQQMADDCALLCDLLAQFQVLTRIIAIDTCTHDGHRDALGLQGAKMGGRINALGHAANDAQPIARELGGKVFG